MGNGGGGGGWRPPFHHNLKIQLIFWKGVSTKLGREMFCLKPNIFIKLGKGSESIIFYQKLKFFMEKWCWMIKIEEIF